MFSLNNNNFGNHNVLLSKDGVYKHLLVYDGKYQNKDTRFLIQDRSSSGAMFLDSDDTVFEYQKYFEVYKLINPNLNRVLFIGGGSNSTAKSLSNNIDNINIDIVDIEPSISEISKIYFKSPNNFNYIVSDGRNYLKNANDKYDLIFCDAYYSLFSIPSHFTTVEFFKEVNDKLSNNGFFFANIISSLSRKDPSIIFSILKSAKRVFPNIYLFSTTSNKSIDSQNLVIIALKNKDLDLSKIIHDKNMNSDNFIEKLKQNYVDLDRYNIDKYQLLIDDFVPIDYYSYKLISSSSSNEIEPDGNEIISIISQQLSYGPRYLGSYGHEKTKNFIFNELSVLNKENIIQKWSFKAGDNNIYELTNIISKYFPEKEKRIILATHYDSLKYAYLDKDNPKAPLPGADDSASGVAILLDIARIISLNPDKPNVGIDLIFFDGEEGDPYFGYNKDWKPIGSNYFSENIKLIYPKTKPSQAIVIDMVCKKNLKILKEGNSIKYANGVVNNFWKTANSLYPDTFLNDSGIYIDDDHMPLNKINIPSILLLDFDYKYFHTTKDTIDKCSYTSLENVEKALLKYIYSLE